MAIAGLTDEEDHFFTIEDQGFHARTTVPESRLELEFAMSLDLQKESRSVYTFFDVLGNVGGLSGILFSVAAAINNALNFNSSENRLVKELYKPIQDVSFTASTVASSMREYLQSSLPACILIRSLRKTRKD